MQVVQVGALRLHHKFPCFTQQQDLRLTVGVDMVANPGKLSTARTVS